MANGLNILDLAQHVPPLQSVADVAVIGAIVLASISYLLRGIVWDKPDPYHHVWFERPQYADGQVVDGPRASRNIAEKLKDSGKDMVIFWGSQSGTAETFANRLARECHLRFGLATMAADLSDYDAESIAQIPGSKTVAFILSTYGEGDPSDNAAGFWEWIQKCSPELCLPNLRYLAFGLGNSSYRHYNRVVDVVVEALDKAGAQCIMPVGKADDVSGGTEEDFLAWKDKLFRFFVDKLDLPERDPKYEASMSIIQDDSLDLVDLHLGEPLEPRGGTSRVNRDYSPIKPLSILSVRELCRLGASPCLHMEVDLAEHAGLRYRTGDHLAVYPINPDWEVQNLLKVLGMETSAEIPLLITPLAEEARLNVPSPTTALAFFRYYLEICAPVSRDTVRGLAQFAPSREVAIVMQRLARDKETWASYIGTAHITVGRLLTLLAPDVVWTDLPLSFLVEFIPHIQPRYYSISSSNTVSPRQIAMTVRVENKPLAMEPTIEIPGLTTNYLLAIANSFPGNRSPAYTPHTSVLGSHKIFGRIHRSKFKLPVLESTPLIMIGAGTGVAPFRGFIQERVRLKAIGKPVGRMLLFFGCRHPEQDYLYKEELAQAKEELQGCLEIVMAFSRDGVRKYVQDAVAESGDDVASLLSMDANLYICGRAAMAREVAKVVESVMTRSNGWDEEVTRGWSRSVKAGNKWQEDVWG